MVIELLSRTPKRTLRLIGSLGTLEWEWQENYIRLFEAKNKSWQEINLAVGQKEQNYVVTEDMYIEEIEHFVAAITGNRLFPYTFADDHKLLRTLFAIERNGQEPAAKVEQ